MRELCENKDDIKFFMCELINEYIEGDLVAKGDRKLFLKVNDLDLSESLLSRIKNYDIDSIKLDSIMTVFFKLKIDFVLKFEPALDKENISRKNGDLKNQNGAFGELSL